MRLVSLENMKYLCSSAYWRLFLSCVGRNVPVCLFSLRDEVGGTLAGAIDVDHESGQTVGAEHHVLFNDWKSCVDVVLVWVLSVNESYAKER